MFDTSKEKQKKALFYERVYDQNDFYCIHFFLWRDYIAVMYLFADVLNIQNDCSCLILQRKNRKRRYFMKEFMIKMIFIAFTSFYGEITLP